MEWYVFRYDNNNKSIYEYNIFSHSSFMQDLRELAKETDKEVFSEKLRRNLMYYFWAKYEHEVLITGLFSDRGDTERKVDIYEQVRLNWRAFVDYVWGAIKE